MGIVRPGVVGDGGETVHRGARREARVGSAAAVVLNDRARRRRGRRARRHDRGIASDATRLSNFEAEVGARSVVAAVVRWVRRIVLVEVRGLELEWRTTVGVVHRHRRVRENVAVDTDVPRCLVGEAAEAETEDGETAGYGRRHEHARFDDAAPWRRAGIREEVEPVPVVVERPGMVHSRAARVSRARRAERRRTDHRGCNRSPVRRYSRSCACSRRARPADPRSPADRTHWRHAVLGAVARCRVRAQVLQRRVDRAIGRVLRLAGLRHRLVDASGRYSRK